MAYLSEFIDKLPARPADVNPIKPPFRGIGNVDIMSRGKDGAIDLVMVSYEHLDKSPSTQKMLIEKLEGYLEFIHSAKFLEKFGAPSNGSIKIRLSCTDAPDPEVIRLLKKLVPAIEKLHASFSWEVKTTS